MAYLEINVTSSIPVYQQIMDQIRALVSRGVVASGKPLPSVRQLAAELAVNPNTVAKAYQLLELEGTIVTLKRRGAFVGKGSLAQAAQARDRRIEEVVDRLMEEAKRLGLSEDELIQKLAAKTKGVGQDEDLPGREPEDPGRRGEE